MTEFQFRAWLWFDRVRVDDFRRSVRWVRWLMLRPLGALLAALTLVACGASSSEPLECANGGVENERLVVVCNRDVPAPPASCERTAPGRYSCNILHTSADDCAALPGLCK